SSDASGASPSPRRTAGTSAPGASTRAKTRSRTRPTAATASSRPWRGVGTTPNRLDGAGVSPGYGRDPMLKIDLTGKRAFVAGVADDGGFGFAIAKSLAEAGASVCVGSWPPALGIFQTLLRRGKMDESLALSDGRKMEFERIVPLDAEYDAVADAPADIRENKRYKEL